MLRKMVSSMLMLVMLGTLMTPAVASTPQDNEVHITKVVVEPSGPDMNFTLYYESSFFTRVFSVIFGAKVVRPSIEHMFANFSNMSIVSINSNNGVAKVAVKNMARPEGDGWYVYDGDTKFTANVDVIEVHNSDGKVVTVNNADGLPKISNRLPAFNKN